jgi:hypothetical protein
MSGWRVRAGARRAEYKWTSMSDGKGGAGGRLGARWHGACGAGRRTMQCDGATLAASWLVLAFDRSCRFGGWRLCLRV